MPLPIHFPEFISGLEALLSTIDIEHTPDGGYSEAQKVLSPGSIFDGTLTVKIIPEGLNLVVLVDTTEIYGSTSFIGTPDYDGLKLDLVQDGGVVSSTYLSEEDPDIPTLGDLTAIALDHMAGAVTLLDEGLHHRAWAAFENVPYGNYQLNLDTQAPRAPEVLARRAEQERQREDRCMQYYHDIIGLLDGTIIDTSDLPFTDIHKYPSSDLPFSDDFIGRLPVIVTGRESANGKLDLELHAGFETPLYSEFMLDFGLLLHKTPVRLIPTHIPSKLKGYASVGQAGIGDHIPEATDYLRGVSLGARTSAGYVRFTGVNHGIYRFSFDTSNLKIG